VDASCLTALSAMGAAVAGAAGFAAKVYVDLKESRKELSMSQEARIVQADEHRRELETLKDMIRKKKKGGQP